MSLANTPSPAVAGESGAGYVPEPDEVLDLTGLRCPEPLMLIRRKMREMSPGGILKALADDPASVRDVHNLCRHLGYRLLSSTPDIPYEFVLEKPLPGAAASGQEEGSP